MKLLPCASGVDVRPHHVLRVGRRNRIEAADRAAAVRAAVARRNAVARERLAGERIEDVAAGDAVDRLREVAGQLEVGRRPLRVRAVGNRRLQELVAVEEERLVAAVVLGQHDRPADREHRVDVEQLGLRNAVLDVLVEVLVQALVAVHVGRGAREPVRAALHADAHRAAAGAAELRVVGVGVDAHFLHGVGRGHEAEVAAAAFAVRVRRAVEQEPVGCRRRRR